MRNKEFFISVVTGLAALFFAAACTQNSKGLKQIHGQVEVDEIDVASRIPARIKKIAVKPGQKVKAGDVLVEFEDDVILAKQRQAEAAMQAAQSKREIAENAVRGDEKVQIRSAVIAARRQMELAKSSMLRARSALEEGAISQQNLDEVEYKYQAAKENYNSMRAKERLAKEGARPEEKAGAQALVDQAKNALAEVEAYKKDLNLTSPIEGEVFQIVSHEGELVPQGFPVMTLLKANDVWVTFTLPEETLKDYPMGKEVAVTIPALGNAELKGTISFLSPMAGFASRTSTQDRGTIDLKTFEVRVTFPVVDPGLRPGMTALVK